MTTRNDEHFYEAANANVYIGSTLCGTLPETIEIGKVYPVTCNVVGDFVKLVTESIKLSFAEVEVYTIPYKSAYEKYIVEKAYENVERVIDQAKYVKGDDIENLLKRRQIIKDNEKEKISEKSSYN